MYTHILLILMLKKVQKASYVSVFGSNIITLLEGENAIEIRLSAQANTTTAYLGRYHKLGFIVAEL